MEPVELKFIRTINPMVILRENRRSWSNLIIRFVDYDNFQQRTILTIQEIKAADMEVSKRRMTRTPKRDGDEEGIKKNSKSSLGIYVTASVEAECRLVSHHWKMKEEDKIKMIKVNVLKRADRIKQCGSCLRKFARPPPKSQNV